MPLGGNRVSRPRRYFNLMVTFLVSGLWHGANWTYVIWGALHGLIQIFEDIFITPIDNFLKKIKLDDFFLINIIRVLITFSIATFTFIIFRANSLKDSIYIISNLGSGHINWTNPQYIFDIVNNLGIQISEVLVCVFAIFVLIIVELFSQKENIHMTLNKRALPIRFVFYLIITTLVFTLGVFHDAGAFIYFQF